MKKILALLIVGTLLIGMTSASAIVFPKTGSNVLRPIQKISEKLTRNNVQASSTEGNFSGQFARKNESGYIILGTVEGTYNMSGNYSGSFEGIWNTTDGNASGTMSGWFWGHFYLGQTSVANESYWFIGLYRTNTTSSEFYSAAIIFTSPHLVRYAAGTYE